MVGRRPRARGAASLTCRMEHDVAIIGCGRVGLPLALAFADRGLRTIGIENDRERLDAVRAARMPFDEPSAPEVLRRVTDAGTIAWSEHVADAARAEHIVITLGTPSLSHIEIDMHDIRGALDDRAGDDRVRRGVPAEAPRLRDRLRGVRRARARADRGRAVLRGDRLAAVHRWRRRLEVR